MPEDIPPPGLTPSNFQRTTGGNLQWKPPSAEQLAAMLPQYEVESLLGLGGMGAVYKGRQKSLDREVAIKILPPEATEDEEANFVERFKNEARTMAKMNHPAIVHVYDFGETADGQLYIVMEFIDGTDVSKMILAQGKLASEHALAITAHVCDALQYAHTHDVIHRDIKPANIMINMEGAVKVADFGLARQNDPGMSGLTQANMTMGTPDYVAPEALIAGMPVDGRADLYAVGVMLYQMLTGKIPRGMFTMPSVSVKADPRYDGIIARAMQADPQARYPTAADMRRDLDVILTIPMAKQGEKHVSVMTQKQPAQKPVARGPQKPQGKSASVPMHGSAGVPVRGSANIPVRTSAKVSVRADAQATAGAHLLAGAAPVKSKTPLFIGIGVAAMFGAGAFVALKPKPPAPAPEHVVATATAPIKVRDNPKPANTSTLKPSTQFSSPTRKEPDTSPESKPQPVLTFAGHRYQLINHKFNWDEAKNRAESRGGHLATITSKEENEWLMKNLVIPKGADEHVFLGGKQAKKNGDWTWVTGEPFDTTLWSGAAPDSGGQKLSIYVKAKRWDDVAGSARYFSLIEWDDDSKSGSASVAATASSSPAQRAVEVPMPAPVAASVPSPTVTTPSQGLVPSAAPVVDPRLAKLAAGFKARYEADVEKPSVAATAALNKSYVTNGLARARAAAQGKGNLAEITALDTEKSLIDKGRGVPDEDTPDDPDSLKRLRATYRTALAKINAECNLKSAPLYDIYLGALDAYIAELTKADKIEQAQQVKALRDDIATKRGGVASGRAAKPKQASGTVRESVPQRQLMARGGLKELQALHISGPTFTGYRWPVRLA